MKRLDFIKTIAVLPAAITTLVEAKQVGKEILLTSMEAIEKMRMTWLVQHVEYPNIYFFLYGGNVHISPDYQAVNEGNWKDYVRIEGGRLGAIFDGPHEPHHQYVKFQLSLFAPTEEKNFKAVDFPESLRDRYVSFIKDLPNSKSNTVTFI